MPANKILFMNTTIARKLCGKFLQTSTRTAASGWKILKQSTDENYDSWRVWNKNKLRTKDRVTPWMEMFKGVTSGFLFEEALWDMLTALFHNWEVWHLLQNEVIVPINTTVVIDFDGILPFGVAFNYNITMDPWLLSHKIIFLPPSKINAIVSEHLLAARAIIGDGDCKCDNTHAKPHIS